MSDIQKLFEGQELSEAFVQKATTLIEAEIALTKEELQEAHDSKLAELEQLAETYTTEVVQKEMVDLTEAYIDNELTPSVDKYLTAAVQEWLEENKLQVEAGVKVDLAESFLKGMVGLVESHDFDIQVEKQDQLAEMQAQLDSMKTKLNETVDQKIELSQELVEMKKTQAFKELAQDLTESQIEKLVTASSSIEFKSTEQYIQAVKTLKESYFPDAKAIEEIVESKQEKQVITESNSYLDRLVKSL